MVSCLVCCTAAVPSRACIPPPRLPIRPSQGVLSRSIPSQCVAPWAVATCTRLHVCPPPAALANQYQAKLAWGLAEYRRGDKIWPLSCVTHAGEKTVCVCEVCRRGKVYKGAAVRAVCARIWLVFRRRNAWHALCDCIFYQCHALAASENLWL